MPPNLFQAASGEVEVQVDAGKVNTTTGWRDLKVLAFAKRPRGPAADPSAWSTRKFTDITARAVLADIEGIQTLRRHRRASADRLGVGSGAAVSVLGDGKDWIWGVDDAQLPHSHRYSTCTTRWNTCTSGEGIVQRGNGPYASELGTG